MPQLVDNDGSLYLGEDILIYRYPAGDCDTINWPNYNPKHLASALYDEYEMGTIKTRVVLLPDGKQFDIDEHI